MKERIDKAINALNKFNISNENELLTQLVTLSQQDDRTNHEYKDQIMNEAEQLIFNLKIAKKAIQYARSKLSATNNDSVLTAKGSMNNFRLETHRNTINENLLFFYKTLKQRREQNKIHNPEDSYYRRGVGMHMRLWSLMHKNDGNCTEMTALAFNYIYQEKFHHDPDEKIKAQLAGIRKIERIDVENHIGGHTYGIINRTSNIMPNNPQQQSNTCVYFDPWQNAVFPASDYYLHMPDCGKKGILNIEFGITFEEDSNSQLKL